MNTPKEIPILFSALMVQALLDGRKKMTRRIIAKDDTIIHKPNQECSVTDNGTFAHFNRKGTSGESHSGYVSKWKSGDIIWVRETWKVGTWNDLDHKVAFDYRASPELKNTPWSMYEDIGRFEEIHQKTLNELLKLNIEPVVDEKTERFHYSWEPGQSPLKWKPNIFMPKEAARIWLKVTSVRAERLHDMSVEDCISEGIISTLREHDACVDVKDQFEALWRLLNGDESWEANQWVWVVSFEVLSTAGKPESLN